MLLGILSDTHSRHDTVARALALLRERGVDTVLHCGDIEDGETVELFRGLTAHFVPGNCDYEPGALRRAVEAIGGTLHEPFGELEVEGRRIAFLHGHDRGLLQGIEHSGEFDFVFYGHTHVAKEHRVGRTRVINPGALFRARPRTFVVLDLPGGEVESVTVE